MPDRDRDTRHLRHVNDRQANPLLVRAPLAGFVILAPDVTESSRRDEDHSGDYHQNERGGGPYQRMCN